ncbi:MULTISPECIES: lipopolysaccharide biosynthesis protein [Pseudomonas]|uniref:lipopolysaccharide biosynthesis protein n=1 Tax=Pseudomonas mosselii TaxID=78327 RepID=UPI0014866647|nr:oligosaccharide flippase family protein [Pseudomonas mosselii]
MKSIGDFNRSFIALASGTLVAQAVPIAISPVLTRLFSPEQLGGFALFVAITTVLGGIAAARYEMAIMLPERQEEAESLAWLSGIIASFFCLLLIVPCLFWKSTVAAMVGDQTLADVLPWLPLAVWSLTLGAIFSALVCRRKKFSTLARANVLKSFGMSGAQVVGGFASTGMTGLVIGHLLGTLGFITGLARPAAGDCHGDKPTCMSLKQVAYRYRDFPKYSMWATLANGISVNVLSFLLSTFYSLAALGFYNLVQRVLAAPSAVVGSAIGQVFYQRASVELRESGNMRRSFRAAWLRLLAISIPPFLVIYLFAEPLFAWVFGENWRVAGTYAEILAPLFWIRFWVSPLSSTNQILQNNWIGLVANLVLLALSFTVVIVASWNDLSVEAMLRWMSGLLSVFYLGFFTVLYASAR